MKDVVKNSEVVAGTGDQCLPFDDTRCGDGGKATEATLTNPRGKRGGRSLVAGSKQAGWVDLGGSGCFNFKKWGDPMPLIFSWQPCRCNFSRCMSSAQPSRVCPLSNYLVTTCKTVAAKVLIPAFQEAGESFRLPAGQT